MSARPAWLVPTLLGASLLVNLVLGGYIAGQLLRGDPPTKAPPTQRPAFERPAGMPEISREDRREVRQLIRRGFETASAELEQRQAAERRLADVLAADPFDRQAAEVALRELRQADMRLRDRIGTEVIGGLDEMTPGQRAWVAWILSGQGERRHHGRRRNGETPPPPPEGR